MELKDLLNEEAQLMDDFSFNAKDIKEDLRSRAREDLSYIFWYHKLALALNMSLLLFFVALYLWFQNDLLLFPLLIICSSYFLIIFDIIRYLRIRKAIDASLAATQYLEEQVALIHNMECNNKKRIPIITTMGFIGGFLSGLIIQGWTFERMYHTPLLLLIFTAFCILWYVAMRKTSFRGLNRFFSKKYIGKKKDLRDTLAILRENERS